jgi:RecB family exonuclease
VKESYQERAVSVTLLNNFFECPWKWYFRNLLQLPEPENDSIRVGNVVHKSIEYVLGGASLKEARAFIDAVSLTEAHHNKALADRLAQQGSAIIEEWMETYPAALTEPYEIERSVTHRDPEIPELTFYGKIDLIEPLGNGSVRVTDWKTGSAKTKADLERTDEEGRMSGLLRQLAMYSYLLSGATHESLMVAESQLVFVEHGVTLGRVIEREEIDRLKKDLVDYRNALENGEWINRPCCARVYGEDKCEYCALASRFSGITTGK